MIDSDVRTRQLRLDFTVASAITLVIGLCLAFTLRAEAAPRQEEPIASGGDAAQVLELLRPGLVRVEHYLRQHQGERPDLPVVRTGGAGPGGWQADAVEALLDEERPVEAGGLLLDPDLVLTLDPLVNERFVDRIVVRFGDDAVDATVERWAVDDAAIFLRLSRPLRDSVPLTIADEGGAPTWSVQWGRINGAWTADARPFAQRVALIELDGRMEMRTLALPGAAFVDDQARVVGVGFRSVAGGEHALLGDPRRWRSLDAAARNELLAQVARWADEGVVRASLRFRSPRRRQGMAMAYDPYQNEGDMVGTELETLAVLLDGDRAAVLSPLPPSATARLEGITLHAADGTAVDAVFESSLRDLSVMTVRLSAPMGTGLRLGRRDLGAQRDRLLPVAQVRMAARQRVRETGHVRLDRFAVQWWGRAYPVGIPNAERTFIFSSEGELIGLPLIRVQHGQVDRWGGRGWTTFPAAILADAMHAGESAIDLANVPLDEEMESRTGWLGASMQAIAPDLADALGLSQFTDGGRFGGLVTSVYPDSPAARAGIEPGMALLAIHASTRPRPIEIVVDESEMGYPGAFPWERLEDVSEEFYDQIPTPWPTIDDRTARTLTSLGLGAAFELEVFEDGELRRVPMTVEQSPPHFGNAPRHEDDRLGVTVRDVSFEVRGHLRMEADQPGVVISSLQPGGRSSLAGLRPFELIVEVDGEPVADAASFGQIVADRTDLRLTVRRGTRTRAVRIDVE